MWYTDWSFSYLLRQNSQNLKKELLGTVSSSRIIALFSFLKTESKPVLIRCAQPKFISE